MYNFNFQSKFNVIFEKTMLIYCITFTNNTYHYLNKRNKFQYDYFKNKIWSKFGTDSHVNARLLKWPTLYIQFGAREIVFKGRTKFSHPSSRRIPRSVETFRVRYTLAYKICQFLKLAISPKKSRVEGMHIHTKYEKFVYYTRIVCRFRQTSLRYWFDSAASIFFITLSNLSDLSILIGFINPVLNEKNRRFIHMCLNNGYRHMLCSNCKNVLQ